MRKAVLHMGCLLLLVSGALAQNNSPMSVSTEEHGPGDRLTLFITFQEPMPQVEQMSCYFELSTPLHPQQAGFRNNMTCGLSPQKDSDTQYRLVLPIDQNIASGEYTLRGMSVVVAGVGKSYQGKELPPFAPLKVRNPKDDPNFAAIKNLKVK